MIAGVTTVRNEADIIETTIRHYLAEGLDRLYIIDHDSSDGTSYLLDDLSIDLPIEISHCDEPTLHQAEWINWLIEQAHEDGADWIVPFDADEFIHSNVIKFGDTYTTTIADTLNALPPEINCIHVPMYQQRDWNYREIEPKPLPKMVFRYQEGIEVTEGAHQVWCNGERLDPTHSVLSLRELQYRGFEHFKKKVTMQNETLDPELGKAGLGFHFTQYAGMTEDEFAEAWHDLMTNRTIWDPVPSSVRPQTENLNYSIEWTFDWALDELSDIQGHLQLLRDLTIQLNANHVIELGVNTGMSTIAFLAGLAKTGGYLDSVDLIAPRVRPEVTANSNWHFHLGDSLDLISEVVSPNPNEYADIVFIDTSHTMDQTVKELKAYGPYVRKGGCIILHDTESCPEVSVAIRHYLHVLEALGNPPVKVDRYIHDAGLAVIWV